MTRTDIHRPSAAEFDPQAYDCLGVFDNNPEESVLSERAHHVAVVKGLLQQGYQIGSGSRWQCGHCGAHIRYCALMVREDVQEYIYVGEQCLGNRFDSGLTKAQFQATRKAAALNRERISAETRMQEQAAEHPWLVWASYAYNMEGRPTEKPCDCDDLYPCQEPHVDWSQAFMTKTRTGRTFMILEDLFAKARKWDLSDKQHALGEKLVAQIEEAADRLAKREAAEAALLGSGVAFPVTDLRILVEGVIVSTKWVESDFGGSVKMLVQTDEGWKAWGTLPNAIHGADKGDRVSFMAKVQASKDDPLFGFFSRPTKATIISKGEDNE